MTHPCGDPVITDSDEGRRRHHDNCITCQRLDPRWATPEFEADIETRRIPRITTPRKAE